MNIFRQCVALELYRELRKYSQRCFNQRETNEFKLDFRKNYVGDVAQITKRGLVQL